MKVESRDYTGKHVLTAEISRTKHKYTLNGEVVPGATTVKKAYPMSEALVQYLIRQGIEQYKSGEKLKRAASIGTMMHSYAHSRRLNLPFDHTEVEQHPDSSLIKHRMKLMDKWLEVQTDKIVMAETPVASVEHKYCGTFDVLVDRGGLLVLQDYKSSKGFYEDQFLQLGLYAQAVQEWLGKKVDMLEVIRFADDAEKPESYATTEVKAFIEAAMHVRAVHAFQQKWKSHFEDLYKAAA